MINLYQEAGLLKALVPLYGKFYDSTDPHPTYLAQKKNTL